jgi:hypothetical protein
VDADGDIIICNQTTNDVYGVTVAQSGFCGYQNADYDYLVSSTETKNKANNWQYAKVCLVGEVRARISANENIAVGDYVLPNEFGYATKSANGIGFRVLSIGNGTVTDEGGSATMAHYVNIALVPQNDNISRLMGELSNTNGDLSNVIIQLGDMSTEIDNIKQGTQNAIEIAEDAKGISDMLNESVNVIENKLPNIEETVKKAESNATVAIEKADALYTEAVGKATTAQNEANKALASVGELRAEVEPLAEWKDDAESRLVGVIAKADENEAELSHLVESVDKNGTDITAIRQIADANGASIQHLVAHADKYSVGEFSLSNGLTQDEAKGILTSEHIYVCTDTHSETIGEFASGKCYKWNTATVRWEEDSTMKVYTNADSVPTDIKEGDLWYCWQDVEQDGKYIYDPETLYRWDGIQWVSVATSGGNAQARSIGLVRQTANELSSNYTALDGRVSTMRQDVDSISTTVTDHTSQITTINQDVESIQLGNL